MVRGGGEGCVEVEMVGGNEGGGRWIWRGKSCGHGWTCFTATHYKSSPASPGTICCILQFTFSETQPEGSEDGSIFVSLTSPISTIHPYAGYL